MTGDKTARFARFVPGKAGSPLFEEAKRRGIPAHGTKVLARKEADMGDALRVDLTAPAVRKSVQRCWTVPPLNSEEWDVRPAPAPSVREFVRTVPTELSIPSAELPIPQAPAAASVGVEDASRPSFSRPRRALRKTILPGLGLALLLCARQGALLPAAAAEYEVSAASFTVDNQINISSAVYIQQMTNAPVSPAINTKLANPGGLYFNGTRYLVWDNNASAWVQLTTGAATVTGSGTANVFPIWGASSALSNGLLVKDGAASVTVMSSTLTVQGQDASGYSLKAAYGIRAGSATLSAGLGASSATVRSNAASSPLLVSTSPTPGVVGLYVDGINNVGVGTTGPGQRLDVRGGIQASSGVATGAWVVSGCANPGDAGDVMVPVGDLCVDKYEASVWSTPTGGTQYGGAAQDYPCGNGVTGTGQSCTPAGTPIYARSVPGVTPSRWITWFQANIACVNAGKHLLSNAEWQAAAAGTVDPGATGTPPNCNVSGIGPTTTGAGTSCQSGYGAQDMVGSLWEWTADWFSGGTYYSGPVTTNWADETYTNAQWPDAGYGADGSWNVAGRSYNGSAWVTGMPAALVRGGGWGSGASAGVFALLANSGPSDGGGDVGFRCGRRR